MVRHLTSGLPSEEWLADRRAEQQEALRDEHEEMLAAREEGGPRRDGDREPPRIGEVEF